MTINTPQVCGFPGCGRPHDSHGLCGSHAKQRRAGIELRPLRFGRENPPGTECAFGPCSRPAKRYKPLCEYHNALEIQGRPLRMPTNRVREEVIRRDGAGRKHCIRCGRWREESDFYAADHTSDLLQPHCKMCYKGRNLFRLFKLTPEKYQALLESCDFTCTGCLRPFSEDLKPHVDHDHNCCPGEYTCGKCIRGLLCRGCNHGIGSLRDSVETMERLMQYLTDWRLRDDN